MEYRIWFILTILLFGLFLGYSIMREIQGWENIIITIEDFNL